MAKQIDAKKVYGVYTQSVLTTKVHLRITEVGKNVRQNLERSISQNIEGRCIAEGFIRPGSVRVLSYSSGVVNNERVEFQTVYECMVCYPIEGMNLECISRTITKAGVHAEVVDDDGTVPITVFIARDHHFTDKAFADIRENANIKATVVGIRFELNDPYICVIAQLNDQRGANASTKKPTIRILNK